MKSDRKIGCNGKIGHESRGKAKGHMLHLKRDLGGSGMNIYKSKFCKKYHVGHNRPPIKKQHSQRINKG